MTTLALYPAAAALVALGGLLVWPVARRFGERDPDRLYWAPVGTRHSGGRRWVPVQPRPARVSLRTRLAGWWADCAPRDPHFEVRQAMRGRP